ncbi:rhomboid family intramembrane serine protease [Amnibacterium setariae]|uniref:Rhomboid family intramembrane serine protease n=1 Tax=Amnibacterium setariae TaxID=2306585 RepID=A0A3A1U9W6_9MICO|nr:rhomboid family intramembrane serine protease [Amnibacterium setariae]RIX30126.1 rhomboid family intramembrane serine protease [Amnibacterium setariae]
MTDGTRAIETDPSVCYRHPGRQSWVLCQRCGRTVCPECQILAPVGVHCPDCVAETSGGVSWRPANNVVPLEKPKRRRTRQPGRVRSMLAGAGGSGGSPVSQGVLVVYAALFLVGLLTQNLPFQWLAGARGYGWQVWRFVTAPVSYYATPDLSILFALLSGVFFWLTAPQLERMLGTHRFIGVLLASSIVGTAGTMLSGTTAYGLTSLLFGLFAALLVEVWGDPRLRSQILIITGINLLLSLTMGGAGLPALVGGMIGGAGTMYLLRVGPDRGWKPRTPVLIVAGVCALLIVLSVVRFGILM